LHFEAKGTTDFLPVVPQPLVGQLLLIIEASGSHSDTPHSVGLLWASDQHDFYLTTQKIQTSMPAVEFEPTIPPSERPQIHALDNAITGIAQDTTQYVKIQFVPHSKHTAYPLQARSV
jgi:hypothetical protein